MLAKQLGWSQRRIITEMGADEIADWMAFEMSSNPEFLEKLASTPLILDAEGEAAAIKAMLMGLTK